MSDKYPLILVFYLDRDLMMTPNVIQPFAESVNEALAKRNANAMAFFIPTDGEERVECINPIMIKEADMESINKMVEDIKNNFSVGVPEEELPTQEITLEENKQCDCGPETGDCGENCNCNK